MNEAHLNTRNRTGVTVQLYPNQIKAFRAAGLDVDEHLRRGEWAIIKPIPLDPLADGVRDHYLAQSRAADQVRRVIAASTLPMDEDDGA